MEYDCIRIVQWLACPPFTRYVMGLLRHTKDHLENGTNCLHAWYAGVRVGV